MMMNIGRVHITGIDASASASFLLPADIRMHGRLSYTWQRAIDRSDPDDNKDDAGTYGGQIAYIPRHSGSVTAGAEWKWFQLNYSWIYVGERWHTSSNIPANYEQPWYTHDLSVSAAIPLHKITLRITAEVNNLLNQQYEVIQNYPMPGRNYKAIVQVEF